MPILRIADRLVYFAHVPKCAGTAVEIWMGDAFGPLAFRNPRYLALPEAARWTRSSPQHVDRDALALLFPDGFFDLILAVVRHPVARLVSVFRFQRDIEGTVPTGLPFSDWLAALDPDAAGAFDNHTRPMDAIVPEGAEVFALEHGLGALRDRVQALVGPDGPTLPAIAPKNVLETRLAHEGKPSVPVIPNDADQDRIYSLYKRDFDRFGYRIGTERPLS